LLLSACTAFSSTTTLLGDDQVGIEVADELALVEHGHGRLRANRHATTRELDLHRTLISSASRRWSRLGAPDARASEGEADPSAAEGRARHAAVAVRICARIVVSNDGLSARSRAS